MESSSDTPNSMSPMLSLLPASSTKKELVRLQDMMQAKEHVQVERRAVSYQSSRRGTGQSIPIRSSCIIGRCWLSAQCTQCSVFFVFFLFVFLFFFCWV